MIEGIKKRLTLTNLGGKDVLKAAAFIGFAVLVKDCVHVYQVYTENQDYIESVKPTEEELNYLKNEYTFKSNQNSEKHVKGDEFNGKVEELGNWKQKNAAQKFTLKELEDKFLTPRESILFVGGGRATLLQSAHPYVGTSIIEHSDLKNSVHRRFILTFKHVFNIIFGSEQEAVNSAKEVRSLHDKVYGEIKEDLGFFKKGDKYAANHLHALYWVHQTLIESGCFMYEMFVRRMTPEEKNSALKNSKNMALAFGIPPDMAPKDYEVFRREVAVFINSPMLVAGEDAKDIQTYLLAPKDGKLPRFIELSTKLTNWITFVLLPRRVAKMYYGKTPTKLEVLLFCMIAGYQRFIYRLLPGGLRYLTAYYRVLEQNDIPVDGVNKRIAAFAAKFTNRAIYKLLPSTRRPQH